ncbi:MAG: alpha/beta fold hydrolase [Trueperaceae bacterium]|nr:MAG: alpha/beta fold hydrolase [Trueperaceae bacterium]
MPVLWSLVALLALALAAATWFVADRVASGALVPAPYGLQPEFVVLDVRAVGVDADGRPVVDVRLPLAGGRRGSGTGAAGTGAVDASVPQFARVDAEGSYGLIWDDAGAIAYGRLGPVHHQGDASVERRLTVAHGEPPRAGVDARLDVTLYRRDPEADLGLAFEDVSIAGPVGAVAAWWLPAESDAAVVMVHGRRRGDRSEALRALPTVVASGASVLVTSYRNHDRSDPSPDGLFHYGASEADDLLAALSWLRERGVRRVVLVTYSMGGAVAMLARERWPADGPDLLGLAMDAPLIDPAEVIAHGAHRVGVPAPFARAGVALASRRIGAPLAALDLRLRAPTLDVPLLLYATSADGTIPIGLVDAFAAAVPADLLTYRRLEVGDHVEAWNVDPERYEAALAAFLEGVLRR